MSRLSLFDSLFSERDPAVIELDEAEIEDVLSALGSGTARQLLLALYEEPHTMSRLAEVSDTSVQNVQYHLQNFEEAGLVEPIDTIDSDQGQPVTVWAPSHDPIVVTAGSERRTGQLRKLLKRLVGVFGALALGSLLVEWVAQKLGPHASEPGGTASSATPTRTPEAAPTMPVETPQNATETASNVTATATVHSPTGEVGGGLLAGSILPGLVFFAGGLFVLALFVVLFN